MKRIAVEEHGSTKEYTDYLYSSASKGIPRIEIVEDGKGSKFTRHWLTPDVFMTSPVDATKLETLATLGLDDLYSSSYDIAALGQGLVYDVARFGDGAD